MDREKIIDNLGWIFSALTKGVVIENDDAVIKAIPEAIAMLEEQEWNMLTEDANGLVCGLPGDDGTYLMTDGEDIWIDDYVDGVDDGVWLDSGRDIREIKAWMYMPKLLDLLR